MNLDQDMFLGELTSLSALDKFVVFFNNIFESDISNHQLAWIYIYNIVEIRASDVFGTGSGSRSRDQKITIDFENAKRKKAKIERNLDNTSMNIENLTFTS